MRRDAEAPDAPRRVIYHGQDVGLGAVEQVNREEVAREDGVGLGAEELLPGRADPAPGGIMPLTLRIAQTACAAICPITPVSVPRPCGLSPPCELVGVGQDS
jgi:hypothetical protein